MILKNTCPFHASVLYIINRNRTQYNRTYNINCLNLFYFYYAFSKNKFINNILLNVLLVTNIADAEFSSAAESLKLKSSSCLYYMLHRNNMNGATQAFFLQIH